MKIYGECRYTSAILDLGTRWKRVVSFRPRPLLPRPNPIIIGLKIMADGGVGQAGTVLCSEVLQTEMTRNDARGACFYPALLTDKDREAHGIRKCTCLSSFLPSPVTCELTTAIKFDTNIIRQLAWLQILYK
jgi:hypothetical protein